MYFPCAPHSRHNFSLCTYTFRFATLLLRLWLHPFLCSFTFCECICCWREMVHVINSITGHHGNKSRIAIIGHILIIVKSSKNRNHSQDLLSVQLLWHSSFSVNQSDKLTSWSQSREFAALIIRGDSRSIESRHPSTSCPVRIRSESQPMPAALHASQTTSKCAQSLVWQSAVSWVAYSICRRIGNLELAFTEGCPYDLGQLLERWPHLCQPWRPRRHELQSLTGSEDQWPAFSQQWGEFESRGSSHGISHQYTSISESEWSVNDESSLTGQFPHQRLGQLTAVKSPALSWQSQTNLAVQSFSSAQFAWIASLLAWHLHIIMLHSQTSLDVLTVMISWAPYRQFWVRQAV